MNPNGGRRWERVKELFAAALEKTSSQRALFLQERCADDLPLRSEVETLIAAHEQAGTFLDDVRAVGSEIGPYKVVSLIGSGGMGQVYRARDTRLGRDVAIKVLHPRAHTETQLRRFEQEARAAGSINHPNILTVYDVGTHQDAPYMVCELLEGRTLHAMLADGLLTAPKAVDYATQLARGLQAAHEKGITHRDLKPENTFVTTDGRVKILDFGIAKLAPDEKSPRTETGIVFGTPGYMSPEQLVGERIDGRSDIFSFGAILYEMLSGRAAFRRGNTIDSNYAILHTEPEPLATNVPAGLADVVRRCLRKDRDQRFQGAGDLVAALEQLASSAASVPDVDATAVERTKARRAPRLWGPPVALLLGVVAALSWYSLRPRGGPENASIAVLPFADLSPGRADSHLGDGIAETLINALASVPGVTVAARTSAFAFRDKALDLREMSRQLGVANVLEGSVQRADDRLRVTARVLRTSDGTTLWSQRFDRPAADIFAVQDEVTASAVQVLQLKLVAPAVSAGGSGNTSDPAAYEAYLLGRYHWNRRTAEGMVQAAAAFQRAVAIDPAYAQAWAGLADAYVLSVPGEYDVPGIDVDATLTKAEQAARKAIELAPGLGEAWASLGETLGKRSRFAEALVAFEKAVAASPGYPTAHQWYSYHLQSRNRWDEAVAEMEKAHRLDPLSHVITLSLAAAYDGADRFADATPLYAQGLAQSPEAYYGWAWLSGHEVALGDFDAAAEAFRKACPAAHVDGAVASRLAQALRDPAKRASAVDDVMRTELAPVALAYDRWTRGDDAVVAALERMRKPGRAGAYFAFVFLGPRLRKDPRVRALYPRLGAPPAE